jgi:hypothetical protein
MFTIPRNNVIESDEGFSVEVLGRTGLLYTEGARSLQIDSEILLDRMGWCSTQIPLAVGCRLMMVKLLMKLNVL